MHHTPYMKGLKPALRYEKKKQPNNLFWGIFDTHVEDFIFGQNYISEEDAERKAKIMNAAYARAME